MRLKTKQYAKLAVTSLVAAFSFGLAISCVSNHKQNINKVFAEDDISTTWSYNPDNKALTCTSASNYPNGFIMETNQVGVRGAGNGQYELAYQVLGYPSNSVQPEYTDYGIFTVVFISGYYDSTASTDGPYGSITAYPLDVSGLDSNTEYEIYLKVEPTGDMNEQNSGTGTTELDGTWTWNQNTQKLSFQFNDTATAGYVSTTSQTMVYGYGNGTYDIGYDLYGTPGNATVASNELLASKTIRLYDGYFNEDTATVTGNSSEVAGLESYGQITVTVDVTPSGDLNTDGWRVNDGQLYFYVLADENPASIDSITWNNSSGNGTGEAILSVTISTNGGSFQQVYQINNPYFEPELEGTSGTTLGNTTVEGISEWSDRPVLIDISNTTYSLGESTQEIRYTITYYPNGAGGDPTNDFTDLVVEGDTAEYMLLENMFSRPDYTFLGWSTDSSSQTPSYEEGEKVYLRSDISYYAVWESQEPEYYTREICFDPANGDNYITRVVEGETLPLSYEISEDLTPTYEGHTFLGWYYEGNIYQPGEVIRDISESIVLVAQWETVAQEIRYTITYYPNGAVGETFEGYTEYTSGDSSGVNYTFERCPEDYYMEGCYFAGWSSSQGGEEAEFIAGETYLVNQDLHVYAVWVLEQQEPQTQPEVTSIEVTKSSSSSYYVGDVIDFENITVVANYSDGTNRELTSNEYVAYLNPEADPYEPLVAGDYALYFTYEGVTNEKGVPIYVNQRPTEEIRYTIRYFPNGDDVGSFEEYTGYVSGDSLEVSYQFAEMPEGFYKEDYRFAGWSTNPDETIAAEYLPNETYSINRDLEVYPVWIDESSASQGTEYIVKFNGNGATSGSMSDDNFTTDIESSYPYILPDCGFERDGYEFAGWGSTDGGSPEWQPTETAYIQPGETTFYAIWESTAPQQGTEYIVIFNGNGATSGSMDDDSFTTTYQDYEYSFPYELPVCDYSRDGYAFAGWGLTETALLKWQPGETRDIQPGETIFYAIWVEIFNISFDANGGTGYMEPISVNSGTRSTVPGCDFVRDGYSFAGWAVNSPDSETIVQPEDTVSVNQDYVLYATWNVVTPEPEPVYNQYWSYVDQELRWVDEAHPTYLTRVDKAIYSERSSTASVLVSILNEKEAVVDTKYISLSNASYELISDGYGSVTGYFNLLIEDDKVIVLNNIEIAVEKIPETPEEKAADVSEEQIAQINSLLPEAQDSRVEEVISDLNQGTAYQIVEVATDAKSFIDDLRQEGGEGYTEADYQRDLQTVQSATEAAVVVGAAAKDTNIATQVQEMTKSAPQDTGVNLNSVLKDFYEQQMQYLLGEAVAKKDGEQPTRRITRAEAPKVNKVDVTDFLKQEFDQMLDFVDRSVDDIEDTLLQVRKCSHESVKLAVNQSITTITSKSFRDFDKEKADREFVETLEPVMMATMQSQVLAVLEEEYNNSDHRNKDKDQVILDEIEAVKDIEMFRIMVMEVLRQKYESLDGSKSYEDDLEKFSEEIYWPCFEAWALDKESPVGFTFEELTKATIESSSKRANSYVIATSADKPEIVFISVFVGVTAVAIAAAIAVPTVLKKKRRGLAE